MKIKKFKGCFYSYKSCLVLCLSNKRESGNCGQSSNFTAQNLISIKLEIQKIIVLFLSESVIVQAVFVCMMMPYISIIIGLTVVYFTDDKDTVKSIDSVKKETSNSLVKNLESDD